MKIVSLTHRLPRVQADADAHGVLRVLRAESRDPLLNADRAQESPASAPERNHERVADRLDLEATILGDPIANDRIVLAQQSEPSQVPESLGHRRRTLDVREEERDG